MPTSFNDILESVLAPKPAGTVENKQRSVLEASEQKANTMLEQYANTPIDGYSRAVTADTGLGLGTQTELEYDLGVMSPWELSQKYGREALAQIPSVQRGARAYHEDMNISRTGTEGIYDIGTGVATGVLGMGHVGSLAAGLVNPELGESVADAVNSLIEGVQSTQSGFAHSRRRQMEARQELSERDSAAQPLSTLERIGKDAVSAVTNSVATGNIEDLLAQGVGSLLGGSAIARGVTAGVRAIPGVGAAMDGSTRVASGVQKGVMTATIGGAEGGAAFADVLERIDAMSHEELMSHPYYRKIYEMNGNDPVDAKNQVKYAAARKAGIKMAAVGAATGSLVSKFEAAPLARRSLPNAGRNIATETIEEAIQGTSSPLISNQAVLDYANPNQDRYAGVGRGLGEGVVAGAGTAGIVQAPGVTTQLAYDGTKWIGKALTSRIDSIEQSIKDSAPVSTKNLSPKSASINQNLPEIQNVLSEAVSSMPVEQQEQANEFVERLINLGSFTDGQYQNPVLDAITQGSASKLEALQKIGQVVADPNVDEDVRILGALEILLTQNNTMALASSNIQAYEQLSDDSLAAKTVNDIVGITQQILNNPEIKDAVEVAQQILEQNAPTVAPVTPENINTPEGQQNIDTAIKVAQVAPEKGNLEANQQILYHASVGDISITPAQMKALEISNALIQAERNSQALGSTLNLSEDASRVNKEITLEAGEKGKSIADHARGIYHALLNNDQEAATQRVIEMGNFAKHMLNKANALTQHINAGKGTPSVGYKAWNQKQRAWFDVEGKQGMFYVPGNKVSEDLAKSIFHEASLAADVYNNMVDASGYGTKVPMPTIPPVVMGSAAAPTRTAPTTTERIPTALHRDIADALGVSITRVRAYSKGQDNALTDEQVQQAEYLIEQVDGITPTQAATDTEEVSTPKKEVWHGVVVYTNFDGMEPGEFKKFQLEPDDPDDIGFNYISEDGKKIAGNYLVSDTVLADFNIASEDGPASLKGKEVRKIAKAILEAHPDATKLHGFRISGMRAKSGADASVTFSIKDGRLILDRAKPEPAVVEDAPVTPSVTTSQSQEESQVIKGLEKNAPKKSSPSFLAPIEAAVDSIKEISPLVGELDSVEQGIRETSEKDALIDLEDKAESLYGTISENVNEIVDQLIDQLDDLPRQVAEGIRDELLDLRDPDVEVRDRLRDLSTVLRIARNISNSTEDLFGDTPSATPSVSTIQSQQPEASTTSTEGSVEVVDRYSVEDLRNNPDKLYVFGDNLLARGKGGQAIIRDEPNAIGIPTKRKPSRTPDSYFGQNIEEEKAAITAAIDRIIEAMNQGKTIVMPADGIGTGLADLANKAPEVYQHLQDELVRAGLIEPSATTQQQETGGNQETAPTTSRESAAQAKELTVPEGNAWKITETETGDVIYSTDREEVEYFLREGGVTAEAINPRDIPNEDGQDISSSPTEITDNLATWFNNMIETEGSLKDRIQRKKDKGETTERLDNELIEVQSVIEEAEKSYPGIRSRGSEIRRDLARPSLLEERDNISAVNSKITTQLDNYSTSELERFIARHSAKLEGLNEADTSSSLRSAIKNEIDYAKNLLETRQNSAEESAQDTTPVVESEAVAETPQTETETPAVKLKGTASVYPQLLGVVEGRNLFVKSFQFPKEQRTRFPTEEAPIQNVQDALEYSVTVGEHLGSKWASRYDDRVADAWFEYLNLGQKLARRVQVRFDHYINLEKVTTDRKTKKKKKNPSLLQRFLKGDRVNAYDNGLLLNIAEPLKTKKGRETAVLNRELLENATIATMDWLLNMRTGGRFNSVDDTVAVAQSLFGQHVGLVSWDVVNIFNTGMSTSEVLTDLGTKIQKYWGMQETNDGFVGDQRGIVESLARELLLELVEMGLVTRTEHHLVDADGSVRLRQKGDRGNAVRTIIRFELNTEANFGLNESKAMNLQATKSLLEELMILDPEPTYYIGKDAIPKTSRTQLRSPLVPLTRQQKKVQNIANRTVYTADTTMASLYGLFGKQQLSHVFGGQDTSQEDSFNINHLKSVEGQNKNIAAAYEQLESLLAEMSSVAEAEGIPVSEVAVRFKHEFASVNRLFLQGPYNPQTSKLMREVLLPTWRNMDLTDAEQLDYFYLALAQGLDISIHKQEHEDSIKQVNDLLTNELKDAVEMVRDFMKQANPDLLLNQESGSTDLQKLKDIFTAADVPFNFLALKSLVEYVKFQDSTDLSNFNTSIYIEADGMTNGPANAMMLFYSGVITPEWIMGMERVGLYFNQPDATANNKRASTQDTYEAGAAKFIEKINEYIGSRKEEWQKEKISKLHTLVSMFNSDFGFNNEGGFEISRGFMKNPLMVMIYGSSPNGVANSIASALVDSIYERMSQAIQRMDADPSLNGAQAMFPEGDSQQQWNNFVTYLSDATGSPIEITSFQEFTLTPAQFTELSKNIKFNLVDSMYAAIQETVGTQVFTNVETMRNAISAMSIYGASLQKQLIDRQMELYKEGEEPYSPRQLLKRRDLREIERKIREVSAYIETANQNFHITGSSDIPIARSTSTGLDGSHHMEGSLQGYGNAGVSGVAYMNQGAGDAQMVQNGYENGGSEMNRVLPAFDGMHFPAADMEAGGRTMNQAVWDSWMANPMKGVADSFRRFMREADLESMDDGSKKAFLEAVGDLSETIQGNAERMQQSLDRIAADIQKNHEVISKVSSTTDQMAGTAATHINEGTVPLSSTDPVTIAEELNALREDTPEDVPPATIRELVAPKGRPATWVQTIYADALPKFLEGNFLNQDQKNVLRDVLNGKYLADWEIMIGSPRSLKDLVRRRGIGTAQIQEGLNSNSGGFTIPGSKQIFIMNDSAETVLHEVLHAATYQKVLDHVEGRTNNLAVERIQGMMDEFMKLTVDDYGHLASTAMQASALQRVISEARSQGNEAVAINEFMAWTLSNVSLTELAKKQTLPKVLQIAKDAWDMLKVLIFGNKHAPRVGTDMYSNLRFNTALIIQTNLGVSELANSGPTLYHDTSKVDPDLVKLDEALQRVIIDQLQMREGVPREHLNKNMLAKEMIIAIQASEAATAAYFNMTNEEAEVFRSVVAALTVEQSLDKDITREANRLYAQVVRNLKVEDFMEEGADPSERAYANAKYSLVTGASFSEIDGAGRSTALPVFFALAMTSREFKDVLSKMPLPKGMKSEETGVDGALENFGYKAMESLGSKLSGTGHATNIQQAMNILGNRLIEQQEARENRLEIPGRWIDKVNDTVVEYANELANKLTPELTDAERAQRTKWDKGLAGLKAALAAAISEDIGARVAEDVTAATDRRAVQHWARELLADVVGRTPGNALIYDMIKQVRSTIQAIRQNYRVNLPKHIKKQFSRDLTEQEWSSLQRGIAKTDIASLALQGYSKQDIGLWASNDTARRAKIKSLEDTLNISGSGPVWIEKAQQLANYMITGEKGINLLRNAEAITDVLGTGYTQDIAEGQTREEVVKTVDALVSLYAVDNLNDVDKANLASIVRTEETGTNYILSYLTDMLREEHSRITPESKYNAYKGFIPFEQKPNSSLIVGHESQHADLITRGYTKVRDFEGANAFMNRGLAYYRMDASAKAAFNQGIIQTAKATTFGVDPNTGYSDSHVVKRITDPVLMKRMLQRQNTVNPLVPVYDASGNMIAVEQGMEASMLETVRDVPDLAETIGKWKGRQQEEVLSQEVNRALVDRLKDQLDADPDRSRYVDVFASEDPVIKDAVANIPHQTREYIHSVFGSEFLVQKNMLRDVLGYRDASIRDSWTGVTRMPKSTQVAIRNMATLIMGQNAYKNMVRAEEIIENLASNAKVLIAIKSGIVPAINIVSNLVHLVSRGVPIRQMRRGIPRKLAEIKEYSESKIRLMELEADYAAATQANERASLTAQMQAIEDGHRRLSIWPLIEAGEFTAISDVDLRDTDTRITSGRWAEYFDETVAKLPEGMNTAGRYFLVSKDTALFNALQKSVEYGDLVAKAILYDDLVTRGQKTKEEALGIITEEFVNYDRLPGRARGKLEKMGLLWFYNFKLRSVKVGLSTLRNNPVHTLLALAIPTDFGIGDAGIPIEDNAVTMALEGKLGYSIGPGQGIRAPALNPWINIIN